MAVHITSTVQIPERELRFVFSRSGGPGGQNVNKVSTRVELLFDLEASQSLTDDQKARARGKLRTRIDDDGILHVASQESRSQWKNRELAVKKFVELLRIALSRQKTRIASKPSQASRHKRVKVKKILGEKKKMRRRVATSDE